MKVAHRGSSFAPHRSHNRRPQREPHDAQESGCVLLVLLCAAQFMVILDVTVVNVALPSIRSALGFAPGDLQWVVTAYVLATGGLLLLGGRIADITGRNRVFLAGLTLFTAASLASAVAPTPAFLVAARVGQGLGAALLSPAALSIITTTYRGPQRTRALSVWGALGGAGAAAGVLLGGLLTTWLGWRSIFFINVPVGVVAAICATRVLPRTRPGREVVHSLDLPGVVTLVGGLVVLVYAVTGTQTRGWDSPQTLLLLGAGSVLLVAFAAVERRASKPLVPPSVWRLRSLVSSTTMMLGVTGLLVGTSFLNSLFFQSVLGASALETGLAFLPGVLVVGAAAHLGPRMLMRIGPRGVVVAALLCMAAAQVTLSAASADAAYLTDLLPGLLLTGLGVGLAFVAISVTAMSDVDHGRAGLASGMLTTSHELGAAVGVAVFSAIALAGGGAADFASGYTRGMLTAAAVAVGLALLATAVVPSQRPSGAQRVSLH